MSRKRAFLEAVRIDPNDAVELRPVTDGQVDCRGFLVISSAVCRVRFIERTSMPENRPTRDSFRFALAQLQGDGQGD